MPKTDIQRTESFVSVDHQPGNGTRYLGMASYIPLNAVAYQGQWLVAFPEHGVSYVIHAGAYLTVDYVHEKFGTGRVRIASVDSPDIHEMTKVIAMMVPGVTHNATTNERGMFPEHKYNDHRP